MIKKTYVKSKQLYEVTFEVPTTLMGENRDIRVLANFNDWSWDGGLVMKNGKGTYEASTHLPAGHYQFRYLADGWDWRNDDQAEAYTNSGYGTINCCFALDAVNKMAPAAKAPAKPAAKKADAKPAAEAKPAAPKAVSKPAVKKAEPKPAAKKTEAKPAAPKAEAKKADDLKRIEGIGPKIATLLNEAGIYTFAELSKASPAMLADVLQAAGARYRLAKPGTWQEQASLAAAGKEEELKKLQEELKGGVR